MLQFLFSILFSSILIFSPGNEVREAMYLENNNFSNSLVFSLLQTARFSAYWIFSLVLIPTTILYYKLHQKWVDKSLLVKNSFYLNRWTSVIILFSIIFICVFPAYWSTGILGQHRTLNVAYFFFLIMWFINLSVWFNFYNEKLKTSIVFKKHSIIYVLLIIGIIFTGNGFNSLSDIFSGEAKEFNDHLKKRNKILFKAIEIQPKEVMLKPLQAKPKTLFVTEVSNDPAFWTNQGYNTYFGLGNTKIYIGKDSAVYKN